VARLGRQSTLLQGDRKLPQAQLRNNREKESTTAGCRIGYTFDELDTPNYTSPAVNATLLFLQFGHTALA
jgi:hypothetical protein